MVPSFKITKYKYIPPNPKIVTSLNMIMSESLLLHNEYDCTATFSIMDIVKKRVKSLNEQVLFLISN